jgi:hypothetical protein
VAKLQFGFSAARLACALATDTYERPILVWTTRFVEVLKVSHALAGLLDEAVPLALNGWSRSRSK